MAEKATDREVKIAEDKTESGGITLEEFEPFWMQMPAPEEEKDAKTKDVAKNLLESHPITFDNAKEAVLLYAISIMMIPTRLKTALELYDETEKQPER